MAFLLTVHLQTVLGYPPLTAGLAYSPYAAGMLAGLWLSSRAVLRFGMRRTLVASFLIGAVGLLLLAGVAPGDDYATVVLPGMLVTSLGCGLGNPALAIGAVEGTTEQDAGLGSAILSSVQQVGGAVGVAVLVAMAARAQTADPSGVSRWRSPSRPRSSPSARCSSPREGLPHVTLLRQRSRWRRGPSGAAAGTSLRRPGGRCRASS
ncbi:MFS transporter [Saccharopolyspora sp. NPDC003752]